MYLSCIEIHGFKSFASKTSLTFSPDDILHKGITAVVGPNGSGKSNISDAIRWVLGEQSVKLLRGKKSEDVIFAGSARKSQMGMAEVVLTINNEDGDFPLDASEVSIGRRLYRDGSSEYYVQGNKVRLLDVQLLLARAGIGGRSYAVIGQGMIDHVLISSPVERKQFFDEAAGVREFEMKKHQAQNKLKASREHVEHAQTVIEELTPRMRSLSRAVKRLEEREEVEKELREAQAHYYGALWHQLSSQLHTLGARESDIRERLRVAQEKRSALQNQLSGLEQSKTVSEELLSLQREYEIVRREREDAYQKQMKAQTELEIVKARSRVVADARQIPQGEVSAVLDELAESFAALLKMCAFCSNVAELTELKERFDTYYARLTEVQKRYQSPKRPDISGDILPLQQRVDEASVLIQGFEQKMNAIRRTMDMVSAQEKEKKHAFFDVQRLLQEASGTVHMVERDLQSQEIERAKLETRRETLEQEMVFELADRVGEVKRVTEDQIAHVNTQELQPRLFNLKHRLEMIGGIDPETVNEYEEVKERYDFLVHQVDDLLRTIEALESGIEDLQIEMKRRRTETISQINIEFSKYFMMLFSGGKAGLVPLYAQEQLTHEGEKSEETQEDSSSSSVHSHSGRSMEKELVGIEIMAQPPGKRIKDINVLSGGERAMTSVALICAILSVSPSPFVVLDEVDAALDEANSARYAKILADLSEKTQFIVVTHNRATMAQSRVLYGVTMGDDGVSQLLSVELEKAQAWAK